MTVGRPFSAEFRLVPCKMTRARYRLGRRVNPFGGVHGPRARGGRILATEQRGRIAVRQEIRLRRA